MIEASVTSPASDIDIMASSPSSFFVVAVAVVVVIAVVAAAAAVVVGGGGCLSLVTDSTDIAPLITPTSID